MPSGVLWNASGAPPELPGTTGAPTLPDQWPGRPIIPDPNGAQQMPPGHDLTRFYALLPLLSILAALNPPAITAVSAALGIVVSIKQLH
ncbi:hypothetical protein [Streptomyces sp. SID161]|uniref:hypothetical protein n=1 Tax=Streptomyces sp. SID161 TaxID=2690251 RepID=UPI001368F99D|nr:hypothetical protein [Streptomyces sp. SID161]MYW46379.1 hypothetical protein [Streptomyces sp. SID161]